MRALRACLISLIAISSFETTAQEDEVPLFELPIMIEVLALRYPHSALAIGAEGWVTFNFMVSPDGEVFDPAVVGSSGPMSLQEEALRALTGSRFEPARLNGDPVEASAFQTYRFKMDGSDLVARREVQRDYQQMLRLVAANNREEAEALLESMTNRIAQTMTETALLNLARYVYSQQYNNDELEQMNYLEDALMAEFYDSANTEGLLPLEIANFARQVLFTLQAKNNRFGEALNTFDNLSKNGGDTTALESTAENIRNLRSDDSSYVVSGRTNEHGYWSMLLFKRGFHIDNLGSRINESRLRCRNKYQLLAFTEGAQYKIPESWGSCFLEILGAADVNFEIVQFN